MTARVTEGTRRKPDTTKERLHAKPERMVFHGLVIFWLPPSFLARACTPLTKSEKKERLLAV